MLKIKETINKIQKSKDGRTLVANFGYLSLLQVASYLFPLITMPYLARVIGVDGFGKIAFASAIMVWFQTIADWGFNYTATRDVAKNRDNKELVSKIFSNVLWARCLLMIVSFLLLLLLIAVVPKFKENQVIILISFLLIPGHILFPDWFFQAMERMKYITILNLISKFLFTIAIFVFIKEKSDYLLQPLFVSLGYILSGLIALYFIIGKWDIKLERPHFEAIWKTIKESRTVFLNNFVPNLYNSFSIILLGLLGTPISNGLLDAGTKFVDTAQQFMNIIGRTFFPYLARRIDKHDFYVKINIFLSLLVSFSLFMLAPLIIRIFYIPDFYEAINILRVLSITIFFMSIRNAYGTHYMILKGYEKELWYLSFGTSMIGFVLAFPLISFFDFWGAVINIFFIKGIMALAVVFRANKIKKKLIR